VIISPAIFLIPHLLTNRLMSLRFPTFLKVMAPPLFAAGVMGTVVAVMTSRGVLIAASNWVNLLGYIFLGGCIYLAVLILIGVVHPQGKGVLPALLGGEIPDESAILS